MTTPCMMEDDFKDMAKDIKEIKELLVGGPKAEAVGMLERLRRVEASIGTITWLMRTSVGAAITALTVAVLHATGVIK